MERDLSIVKKCMYLSLASFVYFAVAHVGLFSEADAAIYLILLAAIRPKWAPYLLLLVASVQDAPGLANKWSYIAFAVVMMITFLPYLQKPSNWRFRGFFLKYGVLNYLIISAIIVVLYGLLNSVLQDAFSGYEQFAEPPYIIKALFMGLIIAASTVSVRSILSERGGLRMLTTVVTIAIVHSLFVSILQVYLGPDYFLSISGQESFMNADQLVQTSFLGFTRITGPFASPNTFALSVALFLMIIIGSSEKKRVTVFFSIIYLTVGIFLGIMTLSKAMSAFFILTSLVLLCASLWGMMALVGLSVLILIIFFSGVVDVDLIMEVFRFSSYDFGLRSYAWEVVLDRFTFKDWLLGTGLSHWRIFFSNNIGYALSDPHTFIFSVPGTFGLPGVIFYLLLSVVLFSFAFMLKVISRQRTLAIMLIILIFGKDLVSIPYVFGNTTVTLLIWININLLFRTDPPIGEQKSDEPSRTRLINYRKRHLTH